MKEDNLKTKLSFQFKILILVVCGIGLYLNFKIAPFNKMILYFTILSNLSCFIFYFVCTILKLSNKLKKNNIYYILKGMVTMAITVTMFVYWMLVASNTGMSLYSDHEIACRFVHLYTPILIIIDYLIFSEKGNLKISYPIIWSSVLALYGIFTILYCVFGGTYINGMKYPYEYMNVDNLGLFKTIINCFILFICYLIYGFAVCFFDKNIKIGRIK